MVRLRQDESGAITDCIPHFKQFFDRGYYNNQFSLSGEVKKKRAPHGSKKA